MRNADVPLPKAVCKAAAAELVSAPGCKKHLGTMCVTSLELAKSDACLPGQKKVSRFQCLKNGRDICLSRLLFIIKVMNFQVDCFLTNKIPKDLQLFLYILLYIFLSDRISHLFSNTLITELFLYNFHYFFKVV